MKKHILFLLSVFCIASLHSANVTEQVNQSKSVLYFIENKGQIIDQNLNPNPAVKYLYNGKGMNIQLRAGGFSYDVYTQTKQPKKASLSGETVPSNPKFGEMQTWDIHFHRVDVTLVGSNEACNIVATDPAPDHINYYTAGTPEEGVTFVHHYSKVTYRDIYPDIDMEFIANGPEGPKYNFIIRPGGDISRIRLNIEGSQEITPEPDKLLIKTSQGIIEESVPESYYSLGGTNFPVTAGYTALGENMFGFSLDRPVPELAALVIDPVPLVVWATYYGGTDFDELNDLTMLNTDKLFTSGITSSANAIATSGVHQSTYAGNKDALIGRFNAAGVRQWATYYGGSDQEEGFACSLTYTDDVVLVGFTFSSSGIATAGTHQTSYGGGKDGFIVKFNGNTGLRIWGTYYGGTGHDCITDVFCDASNDFILSGYTGSSNAIASAGAYQSTLGGSEDAFLAKFNGISGLRIWGTYFGGTGTDHGYGTCYAGTSDYMMTGTSNSSNAIASAGAYQTTLGGGKDAFLAKFNGNTGNRIWGTYYGGSGDEDGHACYLNGTSITLAGSTFSASNIATAGAHQVTYGGAGDAFYASFSSTGARNYATYYGGIGAETFMDTYNNYFIGCTTSPDAIATAGSYQSVYSGANDAFLVKFDGGGTRQWGTYYGGTADDIGYAVTFYSGDNEVYIAGRTVSASGISTAGSHQPTYGGGSGDGFLVKFNGCIPDDAGAITGPVSVCQGVSGYVYSVPAIANATGYTWTVPTGGTITAGNNTNTITVSYSASAVSGNVTVSGINSCGNGSGSSLAVTVSSIPGNAGNISGASQVCAGDQYVSYSVAPIANATSYIWTFPAGASVVSGSGTSNVAVDFSNSAVSGTATVYGNNLCGSGNASPGFSILVNPKPPTPVITLNSGILTSSAATGNQWYVNGVFITGATWQTYIPEYVGNYTTIVTINDCKSDPSNSIYVAVVGTGDLSLSHDLTIYPNPNNGHFMVSFGNPVTDLYTLELFNNQGSKVFEQQVRPGVNAVATIDGGDLPAGLYSLVIRYDSQYELRKIVIVKP